MPVGRSTLELSRPLVLQGVWLGVCEGLRAPWDRSDVWVGVSPRPLARPSLLRPCQHGTRRSRGHAPAQGPHPLFQEHSDC